MSLNRRRLSTLIFTVLICFPVASAQGPAAYVNIYWGLVAIKDKDGSRITIKTRYAIHFDKEGRVDADFECNLGRGTYTSPGAGQIKIGPMAVTKTICPRGSFYDRIISDFQNFRTYSRADGRNLLLTTANGSTYEFAALPEATLEPDPPSSIYGIMWHLGLVKGLRVGETKAYLEFDEKTGRFSGDGGCNRISGNFAVNGQDIRFTNAISTKRACVDTRLQEIETSFFSSLTQVTQLEITTGLSLKAGDREILFFGADRIHPEGRLTVTVTYRQREALPRTAVIEVKLLEVAPAPSGQTPILPDDNAYGVASQLINANGRQVPMRFKVTYDPYAIDPLVHYVVRARIINKLRLVFYTIDWYPVITFGNPDSVEVIVKPVRR
jgi:heat shock protein HslJ/uncharacterized lipoprotein YbaY